jgi:hypothetical protein
MQHLNTLSQLVNAASTVAELARSAQSYHFYVGAGSSCYVHADAGEVRIARHDAPVITISSTLQAPFAWRVAAEQDEAGVYFVALRRPLVGGLAGATFAVTVPRDAHLTLKLEGARLSIENVSGTIDLPPQTTGLSIAPQLPPGTVAP